MIATTQATSFTAFSVNLSLYYGYVLCAGQTDNSRVLASSFIPGGSLLTYGTGQCHAAVFAPEASTYDAACYFTSDGKVYMRVTNGTWCKAAVYGLRK